MNKYILIFGLLFSGNLFADAPQAILWNSLAPGPAKLPAEVNINQSLDGKRVVIPGFVIPLDALEGHTQDFLLSPRQGACIHRPPPGPNQLIHVTFEQPIELPEIEQPVYISGKLTVRSEKNAFAQTGYFIQGDEAIPYPVKVTPSATSHSH